MPKTREQKLKDTQALADRLQRMQGAVLADFTGLKVHEMEPMRTNARAQDCEYLVVKKTLFTRALEGQQVSIDDAVMTGGLSILFGFADAVAPARIAKGFAKQYGAMKICGGFLREDARIRFLSPDEVHRLGGLPSHDELVAKAVGSIAAPLRGFMGVLQGNLRNLVSVLNAIRVAK